MNMPLPIAAIYMAQEGRCFHCTRPMLMSAAVKKAKNCSYNDGWTREHVIPRSKGGRRGWQNVVLAHAKCNHKRGDTDPTSEMLKRADRIRFVARDMIDTINVRKVANDPTLREAHYVHYRSYDPGPGEPKFDPKEWLRNQGAGSSPQGKRS